MESVRVEDLIERSKKNDTEAFRLLVVEYQPLVFRIAFRLLCNEDEAKDIVQETFIRVWLHLNQYKKQFRFSTWIYKIACNLCYDQLRTADRFQRGFQMDTDLPNLNILSGENIEQSVINKELKDLFLHLTSNLTPKQKLVFTLRDIEEFDLEDIKEITGMSGAKIKSNLYLARQHIRNKMNKII